MTGPRYRVVTVSWKPEPFVVVKTEKSNPAMKGWPIIYRDTCRKTARGVCADLNRAARLWKDDPKADVAPASGAHVQRVVGQTESQETDQ